MHLPTYMFSKFYCILKSFNQRGVHLSQAFTNCVHGYDHAHNVPANGITRTQTFEHGIDSLCENNLNLPIFYTDHYALRKQKQPLPQHF